MQTPIPGTVAWRERSALEWQYMQGILLVPAWSLWLNGIGCVGPYPTLLNESKNAQPPRTRRASTIGTIRFGSSALKSPETRRLGSSAARGHRTGCDKIVNIITNFS